MLNALDARYQSVANSSQTQWNQASVLFVSESDHVALNVRFPRLTQVVSVGIFSITGLVFLRVGLNALNSSKHFVFFDTTLLHCTLKTTSMDNIKTLELEILIVVMQNRKVPTHHFYKLFEHKWKLYNSKFNELVAEGLFETVTIVGLPIYELTRKGKVRISELIEQRERDITVRLLQLKQERPVPTRGWKSAMALLNSIVHFWMSSQKITDSEPPIANKA